MLALIAGQGRLPVVLAERLAKTEPFKIYELAGFRFENPQNFKVETFRLEVLGSLIERLVDNGTQAVCFAGAIKRPVIDPALVDAATAPLLARIGGAIMSGDDAALRAIMALFTERGITIRAAHEIAPQLLPDPGVLGVVQPGGDLGQTLRTGWQVLAAQGAADLGQSCVILRDQVLAQEGQAGTDAMLAELVIAENGILFKGLKPGQDRRADMPVIGLQTVAGARRAGLGGIVIQAGGVMVLDLAQVITACDQAGLFLSVVEAPECAECAK